MNKQILNPGIVIMFLFSLMTLTLSAQRQQNKEDMQQKMAEKREAFMIKSLNLTEDESKKFVPVYKAYTEEIRQNRQAQKMNFSDNMSDKDAETQLNKMLDTKAREVEIQRSYISRFKTILPSNKVALIYKTEREYKERVIKNIKNRKQHNRRVRNQENTEPLPEK
ncbi:MAG TPA: hypothetical protein PK611_10500 [Saprospiraceae bacterium]|nr:hypothetical protein [Saprospiraceae bacterium]